MKLGYISWIAGLLITLGSVLVLPYFLLIIIMIGAGAWLTVLGRDRIKKTTGKYPHWGTQEL